MIFQVGFRDLNVYLQIKTLTCVCAGLLMDVSTFSLIQFKKVKRFHYDNLG